MCDKNGWVAGRLYRVSRRLDQTRTVGASARCRWRHMTVGCSESALHTSVQQGHKHVVEYLLQKGLGFDVNIVDGKLCVGPPR